MYGIVSLEGLKKDKNQLMANTRNIFSLINEKAAKIIQIIAAFRKGVIYSNDFNLL